MNSTETGVVLGSGAGLAVEVPELAGALYSIYKGANIGAKLSEVAGPEAMPYGLAVGGLVGLGTYGADKYTGGAVSHWLSSVPGICKIGK